MKEKQSKTKSGLSIWSIILIFVVIVVIISISMFAYAKYISIINGRAEAQIAQFNFTVTGKSYSVENGIIFATTRKDSNSKVAQDMLAPGTYGEIQININASGTQTFVEYIIGIELENKPENLKFYYDEERTLEINVNQIDRYNSEFSRKGFLSFADNDLSRTEYMYWEWPLETGETEIDIRNNDIRDSSWMDTIMTMSIDVKGMQVAEKPMYYVANYGDVVNYTSNGEKIRGVVVNKIADVVEIMPTDENGKAITVGNVTIGYNEETIDTLVQREEAIKSYNNAIKTINKEAIDNYNWATRALTIEDVNRLVNYTPNPSSSYINGITYESNPTSSNIQRFIVDELTKVTTTENETLYATELKGISIGDTIIIGNTYGEKTIKSVTMKCDSRSAFYKYTNSTENPLNNYFNNEYCRLASRCIQLRSNCCYFMVRGCSGTKVDAFDFFVSNGDINKESNSVVPVISLYSNIHAEQIIDENNPNTIIWEIIE